VSLSSPGARGRQLLGPCGLWLALATPATAQIVTENAGVLSPELTIVREIGSVAHSENLDEVRWTQELLYAPDRFHELRLSVPYFWRTARFAGPSGELESHEHGLGDVSVRLKRALSRADDVMRSRRWSLLLELGAPTADSDAEEDGVEIPPALQLGGGGWTLGAGSAWTWIDDRQRVSLEAFYRHRTSHDGVQLGASADLNAAWWYRLRPVAFTPGDEHTEVRGVLELLGTHLFESEVHGDAQDDDGDILWLAPGIHVYPGTHVLLEANVQVPLLQDVDDALGERRFGASLVLKLLF
jgi:hypothetical protein